MRSVATASPAVQPIITPEAVVLDFERAGAASRVIAVTIDGLALGFTLALLLWASVAVLGQSFEGAGAALFATFTSLGMVIVWFCAFETLWRGRTPGKAVMGLRVISADGTGVRFQQTFLRAAMTLVDFFLVPIGFIAVVAVLLSPRDQRLGDMAASTLVVRERSASTFVAPVWFAPPMGWEGYARSLDVSGLDDQTYGLVRSYLLRVHELGGGARDHLAVRIGNPVAVAIGHRPPAYVHPHLFLTCVAAAWQLAHGGVGPAAVSTPAGVGYGPIGAAAPPAGAYAPGAPLPVPRPAAHPAPPGQGTYPVPGGYPAPPGPGAYPGPAPGPGGRPMPPRPSGQAAPVPSDRIPQASGSEALVPAPVAHPVPAGDQRPPPPPPPATPEDAAPAG